MEPAVGAEASDATLVRGVDEATVSESLTAVVELLRSDLEAVVSGLAQARSELRTATESHAKLAAVQEDHDRRLVEITNRIAADPKPVEQTEAFRGEIAEAESRLARSLDAHRAELYDALTESFTQARLEVAALAQQLHTSEASVARLAEAQGGQVAHAPVPAPARPSLLDDLDRQLREAETRLSRRLSTRDR